MNLIEEYAAELWGMKIDYVDVEEHVLELGKLIVDKYEEKYHLDLFLTTPLYPSQLSKIKSELKKLMKMLGI